MLGRRRGSKGARRARPQLGASTALLVGLMGLVVVAVTIISAAVAAVAGTYLGGLALGCGLVGTAWVSSTTWKRFRKEPAKFPGRSRTQDCRQARWAGASDPFASPRPPTHDQRRIRPCPGSRRP
jgi:hypothetical protein